MEHDLRLADTPDENEGVFLSYFPELNPSSGFPVVQLPGGQPGRSLPLDYKAPSGRIYHPKLPAGVAIGDMIPALLMASGVVMPWAAVESR